MMPIRRLCFKPSREKFRPLSKHPDAEKLEQFIPKPDDRMRLAPILLQTGSFEHLLPSPQDIYLDGIRIAEHVSVFGDSLAAQFQCGAGFLVISSFEDPFGDPWGLAGGFMVWHLASDLVVSEYVSFMTFYWYEERGDGKSPKDGCGILTPASSPIHDVAVESDDRLTFRMKSGPKVWVTIQDRPRCGRIGWLGVLGERYGPPLLAPRRMKVHRSFLPFMPQEYK